MWLACPITQLVRSNLLVQVVTISPRIIIHNASKRSMVCRQAGKADNNKSKLRYASWWL